MNEDPDIIGELKKGKEGIIGNKFYEHNVVDKVISEEQLKSEFQLNTTTAIRCPRCHLEMEKIEEHFKDAGVDIMLDFCKSCKLLWFDGGELATLQQSYEASPEAQERREMLSRMKEFENDPERQQKFAENVAKAPDPMNPYVEGLRGAAKGALLGESRYGGQGGNYNSPFDDRDRGILDIIFSLFTRY
jgi:Zn-finger nucleic acid-binding protein